MQKSLSSQGLQLGRRRSRDGDNFGIKLVEEMPGDRETNASGDKSAHKILAALCRHTLRHLWQGQYAAALSSSIIRSRLLLMCTCHAGHARIGPHAIVDFIFLSLTLILAEHYGFSRGLCSSRTNAPQNFQLSTSSPSFSFRAYLCYDRVRSFSKSFASFFASSIHFIRPDDRSWCP